MKYLLGTQELFRMLRADKRSGLEWYVDTALTAHLYFKLHTGETITMGKGTIISVSQKQKLNRKISMEAKLVGADDASSLILWTKHFLEA